MTRPISTARPVPAARARSPRSGSPGQVRVDHRAAALGQGDEAGRLRAPRPAAAGAARPAPGPRPRGRGRPRSAAGPGPPSACRGRRRRTRRRTRRAVVGRRLDPDRVQPAHGGAGQGGERGRRAGHRSTVGRAGAPIVEACRPAADSVRPSPTSPCPDPTCCAAASCAAEPDLLPRLLAEPATRVLDVADGRTPVDAEAPAAAARADASPTTRRARRSSARTTRARRTSWSGGEPPGEGWVDPARDRRCSWTTGRPACWPRRFRCPTGTPAHTALPALRRADRGRPRPAGPGSARSEGSEHYPRTDPAVIMAVVDDDDRLLLGHGDVWPAGRMSTLAGFVEPGESLEAAVRREVVEEVGVAIGEVIYRGSQPWPFPASIMLGFRAYATTTEIRGRRRRGRRGALVHPGVDARRGDRLR